MHKRRTTHAEKITKLIDFVGDWSDHENPDVRHGMAFLLERLPMIMGWNATTYKRIAIATMKLKEGVD